MFQTLLGTQTLPQPAIKNIKGPIPPLHWGSVRGTAASPICVKDPRQCWLLVANWCEILARFYCETSYWGCFSLETLPCTLKKRQYLQHKSNSVHLPLITNWSMGGAAWNDTDQHGRIMHIDILCQEICIKSKKNLSTSENCNGSKELLKRINVCKCLKSRLKWHLIYKTVFLIQPAECVNVKGWFCGSVYSG